MSVAALQAGVAADTSRRVADTIRVVPQPIPSARLFAVTPSFWWNRVSDATVGLRFQAQRGPLSGATVWLTRGVAGDISTTQETLVDWHVRVDNPFSANARSLFSLEGWSQEGTVGARIRHAGGSAGRGGGYHTGTWTAEWVATREIRYLDPALWENAGTVEVGRTDDWVLPAAGAWWRFQLDVRAGGWYVKSGSSTTDPEPFARLTGSAALRKPLGRFVVGLRAFGGFYGAEDPPVRQRALPLRGADPYQTLGNPFVRTDDAPLVKDGVFYHSPGNGNLRAFQPGLAGRWILAGNVEVEGYLVRANRGVLRTVSLVAFGDGALVDTLAARSFTSSAFKPLSDGGAGLRIGLQLGATVVPIRVEFPFLISDPDLAYEDVPGRTRAGFRWLISLQPIF